MSKSSELKRRKKKLMEIDPHCYWCGIEVHIHKPKWRVPIPDDAATIDHLRTKYNPERGISTNTFQTVLSCRKCNQDREKQETQNVPLEDLWERSRRKPTKEFLF